MGADGTLNAKGLRRMERLTGKELILAVAIDHNTVEVVTPADFHYRVDKRTGEATPVDGPPHFSSCPRRELLA
jgi:hypothetical protein